MLRYSFGLTAEAQAIEDAIAKILREDYHTYDITSQGKKEVGTKEMGDLVAAGVRG